MTEMTKVTEMTKMNKPVLVASGTSDSAEIIKGLLSKGYKVIATVATGYGNVVFKGIKGAEILSGRLSYEELKELFGSRGIKAVIDATHPFAVEISKNCIRCCEEQGIPYIRFERESISDEYTACSGNVIKVRSYEEAALTAENLTGRIFLATGSSKLDVFTRFIPVERLVARVLPESVNVAKCESLGFTASNITAMKGPFSKEINVEMFKHYNISVVVTKDSGKTGGADDKIEAAAELGIKTVLILRPEIAYPNMVNTVEDAIKGVESEIGSVSGIC